jgi:uncharacterized protein involved in outer membrane biogenesis
VIRRFVVVLGLLSAAAIVAIAGTLYWLLAGDGVRLALERQASAWLGAPVRIGIARPTLVPRPGLHLERIEVGNPVRLTLGSVDIASDGRALLSRRIEHASIEIANSRIGMPLPFTLPESGTRTSDESTGIHLVSVQAIRLHDIVLESRGRQMTVSADSSLSGSRLLLRSFTAATAQSKLEALGEVDLAPRVDARLRVKADRFDVDELLALASAFTPAEDRTAQSRQTRLPVRIVARLSAETARAAGLEVRQFATDLELDGTRLSLSPLTFQLFGGRYQGALTASLQNMIAATLASRILDVDVAQLAAFGGNAGSVTGRLTGAGTFSGAGVNIGALLRSIHGDGTATITDGSIKHLNLVPTIVLFFGRPAPDAVPVSDAFQRLDATVAIANRVVTAAALSLHSNDADIVGSGTLRLDSAALEGQLDMSLSEALSKQAGTDLYRYTREGTRVVLPARLGGTLEAPRLTIDAAAAVQRGLRNEIERRLGGLLDRLRNKP